MKTTLKQIDAKLNKILKILEGENPLPSTEIEDDFITIKDDGKKKTSEILDDCRKLFKVWSYYSDEDLDRMFPPIKSEHKYRYVQEADSNWANYSANDLEKKGIRGILLRERLLFELLYFKKEGKHLDIDNVTLCSGSRCYDGGVPHVCWYGSYGKLSVDWCYPGYADDVLRAREVIE